jgi:alkane 1-monooxygenase
MNTAKRTAFLLFLVPPLLPVLSFIGARNEARGGGVAHFGLWSLLTPLVVFGAIPVLDLLIGRDSENPTDEEARALAKVSYFTALLTLCLPLQLASIGFGVWVVTTTEMSFAACIGWAAAVGIVSGILGINVGHELIHRKHKGLQTLGGILLATTGYASFKVEHVLGHHVHIATPVDGTSAKRGESVYPYLLRALRNNIPLAFALERKDAERKAKAGKGAPWSLLTSELVRYYAFSAALVAAGAAFGCLRGGLLVLGQGVVAILTLEVVNYVEHYGLERKPVGDKGAYEVTTLHHSWNSNYFLTNLLLFQLQRHSDHHANAARPYQALRHMLESPQLPLGYAGMVTMALCPPLFKAVMAKALSEHAARAGAAPSERNLQAPRARMTSAA